MIAYSLQRVRGSGLQPPPSLSISQGGRAALIAIGRRSLDAIDRIAEDGIPLAEIIKSEDRAQSLRRMLRAPAA